MSLLKLKTAIKNEDLTTYDELNDFINDYIDASVTEYKTNVKNNCLNFGKWKGMTIKEVCGSDKGKDYLTWLLKQSWFSEEKNSLLFDDLRTCGIIRSPAVEAKEIVKEMERKEQIKAPEKKPRAKKEELTSSTTKK
jgi:hypothetical protein